MFFPLRSHGFFLQFSVIVCCCAALATSPDFTGVEVSASSYQISTEWGNHPPSDAIDGNFSTYWAAEGSGEWISFKYPESRTFYGIEVSLGSGTERTNYFEVQVSQDGDVWIDVCGVSQTRTEDSATVVHSFVPITTPWIRLIGKGNSENTWNNYAEIYPVTSPIAGTSCGDGICSSTENCSTCEADCGPCQTCTNGETRACPDGSNVGLCSPGTQTCENGEWGSCEGGISPVTEVCGNGFDDNCNGQVDELCGSSTTTCRNIPTDRSLKIAFVGNSLTSHLNVYNTVKDLASSAGMWVTPAIGSSFLGGQNLSAHRVSPQTLALIDQGNWDVVVLQDFMVFADPQRVKNDVAWFHNRIKVSSPNATIVLYQTWAYPAISDYCIYGGGQETMQAKISSAYASAAEGLADVEIAPVGDIWVAHCQSSNPIYLYSGLNDGKDFHQGEYGAYLSALVLYATIYQSGVNGLSDQGRDAAKALQLRDHVSNMLTPCNQATKVLPPNLNISNAVSEISLRRTICGQYALNVPEQSCDLRIHAVNGAQVCFNSKPDREVLLNGSLPSGAYLVSFRKNGIQHTGMLVLGR